MTTPRKRAAIERLFAAFNKRMDEVRLAAWLDALADLNDCAAEIGLLTAMRECRRLPVPAQVRQYAEEWADEAVETEVAA